ncbi:unnamed protein product [Lampetra fluviatilis]
MSDSGPQGGVPLPREGPIGTCGHRQRSRSFTVAPRITLTGARCRVAPSREVECLFPPPPRGAHRDSAALLASTPERTEQQRNAFVHSVASE